MNLSKQKLEILKFNCILKIVNLFYMADDASQLG